MSVTYVDPQTPRPIAPEANARELEGFTPVFARGPVRRKTVRSWMILAPVGALTLAAFGAWMVMSPSDPADPITQAAPEPPAVQGALAPYPAPLETEAGLAAEPVAAIPAPRQETAPPPVARTARPAPRPVAAPAAEPVQAPVVIPTGPQPYEAAVAADPAPATPAAPVTVDPAPAQPAPFVVTRPD